MALEAQFYDQLSQRLNRQDEALSRIEKGQDSLMTCMSNHKSELAAHVSSDQSNFKWIKWIMGGVWITIFAIITLLLKG